MLSEKDSNKESESDLDRLKKRLYKGDETFRKRYRREVLSSAPEDVKTYWSSTAKPEPAEHMRAVIAEKPKRRERSKLFFGGLVFALIVLGVGLYFFRDKILPGNNIISSKNIEISTEGPSSIKAGSRSKWYVVITNKNKVNLELADLVVDYPANTLSVDSTELKRERRTLGLISPGQTVKEELNAYVFGNENENKDLFISLEYRPEDSNAIFVKELVQSLTISQSPIGVSMNLPSEIESGQRMDIAVEYVSNSEILLRNLALKMEYPPGFQYIESNPAPVKGNDTWSVGDLAPNEKRVLKIKGILEGQDMIELAVKASIGVLNRNGDISFFGSVANSAILKKPFLNFYFRIQNEDVEAVRSGERVTVTIPFKNNLPVEVRNVVISTKLVGETINRRSVYAVNGFYRSQDDTVIWNVSSMPELKAISPGGSGSAKLAFSTIEPVPVAGSADKNFTFFLKGEIVGIRSGDSGQAIEIKSAAEKEIKIITKTQLASRALYYSGPFSNSGPIPPKAGEETMYTIVWSITNFYNDISGATVRASMPSYVRWLGVVEPASEDIFYDVVTGEIVWKPDFLEAGTGILRPAKEVSFQIGFLPGPNQIGTAPQLISQSSLEAKDNFTGTVLRDYKTALTTNLDAEPGFSPQDAKVAP